EAPVSMPDGTLVERTRGTPQGAVVSPVLANLFLHYVFDLWMRREHPDIPFERYADDAICHCRSEAQALELRQALEKRFADCKLQLHPQKTKIVYCKDANRPGEHPERSFDFLGYTFRPRVAVGRGRQRFVSFIPAVSDNSPLIKSVVVPSIAKYWAAKPQMAQYVVSPMRRRHFVNGLIRLPRGCGRRCEGGDCTCVATLSWKTSPSGSAPPWSGGCATTGGSTPPSCRRNSARSTLSSCDG